jgi:hypothetical protein
MDYVAPPEHNTEFATVKRWAVLYTCPHRQESSISTEGRYVRQTCRSCGTVWETSPSFCDSTPYTVEKAHT